MATKKKATTQKTRSLTQIPEHIELVAHEGGVAGALTLLDNMTAMLSVLCAIDREGESIESADLAKVFFILYAWTDFARNQISAEYNEKKTAA